jgi:hypothetical protein
MVLFLFFRLHFVALVVSGRTAGTCDAAHSLWFKLFFEFANPFLVFLLPHSCSVFWRWVGPVMSIGFSRHLPVTLDQGQRHSRLSVPTSGMPAMCWAYPRLSLRML